MPALLQNGGQAPLLPHVSTPFSQASWTAQACRTFDSPGSSPTNTPLCELSRLIKAVDDDDYVPSAIIVPGVGRINAISGEISDDASFYSTLQAWLSTRLCGWLGVYTHRCSPGLESQNSLEAAAEKNNSGRNRSAEFWTSGAAEPESWSDEDQKLREIPQYVLDYAPMVHLYSGETYWPGDIADHLQHTTPHLNYTALQGPNDHPNLTDLNQLNSWGPYVYLQSDDDPEEHPDWLAGQKNMPARSGTELPPGRSEAPAILVVVPKPNGIVDAFWFFFYSFNEGNSVFNIVFGNHVGDWEHTMVRFKYGEPEAVYYSEHGWGDAYTYAAVEKNGKRPVSYSAVGSHAMYATPGDHEYGAPYGLLKDQTDKGPFWDPALNFHGYTYNHSTDTLRSSTATPKSPIEWFYYGGRWGDKIYPIEDPRQYEVLGRFYHYVSGPLGPRFKRLGRSTVCQGDGPCHLKHWLGGSKKTREWPTEVDEMSEEDRKRFFPDWTDVKAEH